MKKLEFEDLYMSELSEMVNDIAATKNKGLFAEKIKNLLDAIKIPENIKDIPDMPIHDLRDLTVEEAKVISELIKAKTIRELSKVTYDQIVQRISLIKNAGISKTKLELLITAAKYIVQGVEYKPPVGKKIVIAGLDNAGKTALLKAIKKEVGFSELSSIKPTRGAMRDELELHDQSIHLVELGGQEEFRKFYIEKPERFFLDTDIIVYLIDMQDDERFQESFEYLQLILRSLEYLQESSDFIFLLHKCDPDVVKPPFFQEKIDYAMQKIGEIFKPYKFKFEIQTSSIYNIISMTPSFSRMIKGIFSGGILAEDQKIQSIGNLLMKLTDLFLDMEVQLSNQIKTLKQRVDTFETQSIGIDRSKAGSPLQAPSGAPKPVEKPGPSKAAELGGLSTRAALINELKAVFGLRGKA